MDFLLLLLISIGSYAWHLKASAFKRTETILYDEWEYLLMKYPKEREQLQKLISPFDGPGAYLKTSDSTVLEGFKGSQRDLELKISVYKKVLARFE